MSEGTGLLRSPPSTLQIEAVPLRSRCRAEALSGVEPSRAGARRGSSSRHPRPSRLISSPSLGCCFPPQKQRFKRSSDLPAFYFPFLYFAKRASAKRRAFPRQRAGRCRGVGDLRCLAAVPPRWRAPNQLPPHRLGPVGSITARAKRGLGNAAQRLPGIWSRFWSRRPAPVPSQLAGIGPAKGASLADSSNDSSFRGRAGWEHRGHGHKRGDPGWAGNAPARLWGPGVGGSSRPGTRHGGLRVPWGSAASHEKWVLGSRRAAQGCGGVGEGCGAAP